ncbi:MAG: putative methyltransferase [Alphaproteobacteria bacterium]|jgi:predicted methyltransferase
MMNIKPKQTVFRNSHKFLLISSLFCSGLTITGLSHGHDGSQTLQEIVLERDAEDIARDKYRNPVKTLSLFHVEPGMKVAESLPGDGWYSKILAPYLGADGALYGINYNDDMWAMFGFFTDERIEEMSSRTGNFPDLVKGFTDNGIQTRGFTFATAPKAANGSIDRVLFIRALHNLNRFEEKAGTRTEALKVAYDLLTPNGLVGVVQHRAPEDAPDDWANGSAGYLKQSTVIQAFENAGFELVMTSELNANSKDKPSKDDIVWRLPPGFNGISDDAEKRAQMTAIGESDRMTLLFKKKGAELSH